MIDSYIPIARRYRPLEFADLVGQEVLAKTLSYSILNNKIANAYLFSGTRGIGKTTSARIVAKAINCTDLKGDSQKVVACGQCKNCLSAHNLNHPDILEIDAASRTSVDDVRTIIEGVEYKPLMGKFKVFIIDEVHMLSKSAFNALLKTLEEPPSHVIFIFATTEINKIPLTILSRCQRFDLRRLTTEELSSLLKKISEKEGIKFENDAIELISLKADGSARDAISMLDQASSLSHQSGGIVNLELVSKMVGAASLDIVTIFLKNVIENDAESAIKLLEDVYVLSADLISFFEDIVDLIGYMSKVKIINKYKLATYSCHHDNISSMAAKVTLGRLTLLWQIFSKGIIELKTSHNQQLCAEMVAIKAIYASSLPTPKSVVENALKEGLPRRNS
ncbi:MAG: DNA polymerase III subunit gamma/tau [Rickettsiaceae bacterium]|nr:DNA polymerase III subunit gamma/tau [Rickettsiaceae bacterium]